VLRKSSYLAIARSSRPSSPPEDLLTGEDLLTERKRPDPPADPDPLTCERARFGAPNEAEEQLSSTQQAFAVPDKGGHPSKHNGRRPRERACWCRSVH